MYNPKLKLFISIDFIDSTSFKSKEFLLGKNLLWSMQFLSLQDDFSSRMQRELNYLKDEVESQIPSPSIWKLLGDEIIYTLDVENTNHLPIYIQAAKQAVEKYNNNNKDKDKLLKVKGTAWLAETPVRNAIIKTQCATNSTINNQDKEITHDHSFDVIGPSMDIGFRISKFATKRKFVVSIELAYILTSLDKDSKEKKFHFFFEGQQDVKGVLDNHKYPIIWIDVLNRFLPIEEELLGLYKEPAQADKLNLYCSEFIKQHAYLLQSHTVPSLDDPEYKKQYDDVCAKVYQLESVEHIDLDTNKDVDIAKIKPLSFN